MFKPKIHLNLLSITPSHIFEQLKHGFVITGFHSMFVLVLNITLGTINRGEAPINNIVHSIGSLIKVKIII